jgi:hypothetical protein
MDTDRYPTLGDRILVKDFDAAFAAVRAVYPDAGVQGSTGFERSFERTTHRGRELVAHCWPKSRSWKGEEMYVRILPVGQEGILS